MLIILSLLIIINVLPELPAFSKDIAIKENLGGFVPMYLSFYDEHGTTVKLKQLIHRPIILSLVYYNCADLCSPLLNSMADLLNRLPAKPGEDYDVLSISFDETDTPSIALQKKQNYLKQLPKTFGTENWKFLTGDMENIRKITDAVGFNFKREGKGFLHTASLIILSDEGRIIRYMYGLDFLPFDVKMAIIEAMEERPSPTIAKVLRYCFSYDPDGRRYALNITRIVGAALLSATIPFFVYLIINGKKKENMQK